MEMKPLPEDLYEFDYNVPRKNTWSNDPSLTLKVKAEKIGEADLGMCIGVEIIGMEFTNQYGKRDAINGSIIATAMRVKDWPKAYKHIREIAKIEFEQRAHVKAAQELTNKKIA